MIGGSKHTGGFRRHTEPFIFEWAAEQTSQRRNIGGSLDYTTVGCRYLRIRGQQSAHDQQPGAQLRQSDDCGEPLRAGRRPVLLDRD
ncbi:hypothetical protein PPTG_24894, partial [Phytophthora nicotianae INRA-310]